jgi:hypothetical protein
VFKYHGALKHAFVELEIVGLSRRHCYSSEVSSSPFAVFWIWNGIQHDRNIIAAQISKACFLGIHITQLILLVNQVGSFLIEVKVNYQADCDL